MPLYLNELAPWERKKEYYHTIQLGKDVKEQTNHLNKQTKTMIATQLASTSAVIASQEKISESISDGLGTVGLGIEKIEQGISGLKSTFEWGISEVVWQIEQNRAVLRNILEVLMAPLNTQAKERRKRAEEAYSNGWIDDAEEEFLESEKLNKFDFSIHISLGMIYLFNKIDKEKALSYFEKAIKYSKVKSAFHASYALLYKALIHYDKSEIEEAEKASYEAITLSPNFSAALYQNAQYNALLQNVSKSINNLEKAIQVDPLYCLKAEKDEMFNPIRQEINNLFEKIRDTEKEKSHEFLKKLHQHHKQFNSLISEMLKKKIFEDRVFSDWTNQASELDNEIKNIQLKIERNSFLDFIEINEKIIPSTIQSLNELIFVLKRKLNNSIKTCNERLSFLESKQKDNSMVSAFFWEGFLIALAIVCLKFLEKASGLWFVIVFASMLFMIFGCICGIVLIASAFRTANELSGLKEKKRLIAGFLSEIEQQ